MDSKEETDFTARFSALRDEIDESQSEFYGIVAEIGEAEKTKEAAKLEYTLSLDRGDEVGMSACLRNVREANKKVEFLHNQMADFRSLVDGLRARQSALHKAARGECAKAGAALRGAQDVLRVADLQEDQAGGLLMGINRLADLVSKSQPSPG